MNVTPAITKRQLKVLAFLRSYSIRHGYAPTVREVCAEFSLKSPNSVNGHLKRLQANDLVTWRPGSSRTVVVTPKGLELLGVA